MLFDSYLLYLIFAFFMFFLGLTNILNLVKQTRLLIMVIAMVLFIVLAFTSFNIEDKFCAYSNAQQDWLCTTQTTQEMPLAVINGLFVVISLVYILAESFNWIPTGVTND